MCDQTKRVLLVDDDENILETVSVALAGRGYEVLMARDGAEALIRAERDTPDLIVLDVVMPKRSGFTVLERLYQSRVNSPRIIIVTANDEPRHREFAASRGVDAFLAKPFDLDHLLKTVDSLLNVESPSSD